MKKLFLGRLFVMSESKSLADYLSVRLVGV